MTNFFIRQNNSLSYIRESNGSFSIRSSDDSGLIEGLVLNVDAGNISSYPGTGTTWYDLALPSNDLTLFNSSMYNTTYGSAMNFVGGQWPNVPRIYDSNYDGYLNFGTDSFSIELWARKEDTVGSQLQGILNIGSYQNGVLLRYNGPGAQGDSLYIAGSYYNWDPVSNLPSDKWTHIVIVKDGTSIKLYVDTNLVVNENNAPLSVSPSGGILLGYSSHDVIEKYRGYIRSLKIYRGTALTSSQIINSFNQG